MTHCATIIPLYDSAVKTQPSHWRSLHFQETTLHIQACRKARQLTILPHYAMTWHHNRERIGSHRLSDSARCSRPRFVGRKVSATPWHCPHTWVDLRGESFAGFTIEAPVPPDVSVRWLA